jgi:hypothetical protein
VPQAIIDMNRVVEVSYEAEEVTGHPFSLALTAADRVHFLKGTSREESKWWFDILSMFPRTNMKVGHPFLSPVRLLLSSHRPAMGNWPCPPFSLLFSFLPFYLFIELFFSWNLEQTGRHKRNATFPGSKATTIISTQQQQQHHQQSTAPNSPCLSKGEMEFSSFFFFFKFPSL